MFLYLHVSPARQGRTTHRQAAFRYLPALPARQGRTIHQQAEFLIPLASHAPQGPTTHRLASLHVSHALQGLTIRQVALPRCQIAPNARQARSMIALVQQTFWDAKAAAKALIALPGQSLA